MATVTKKNITTTQAKTLGGKPYGNVSALEFPLVTNASGVWVDSDQATAVAIADILKLGIIPKGTRLLDCMVRVSTALKAATTCKVGFKYVDGVDVTAFPESDVYFMAAATALSSAATLRSTGVAAQGTLSKDAYLTVTIAGATQDAASAMNVVVIGISDLA